MSKHTEQERIDNDKAMEQVEEEAKKIEENGGLEAEMSGDATANITGPMRQTPGHKNEPDLRYKANREDIQEFHDKQKEAGQE